MSTESSRRKPETTRVGLKLAEVPDRARRFQPWPSRLPYCACFLLVCTYYERVLGSQSNSRHRLLYVNTILMACTLRVLINVCAHLEVFTRAPAQSPAAPLRHVVHTSSELRSVIPVFSGIRLFLCPHDQGNKVSPHRISERKTMLHLFLHYYMTSSHDDKTTYR